MLPEKQWQGACVAREWSRCEKTEAAINKPIAAPASTLSGTRPPLRNLCVLPAVRAAGGGFRRRRGAPCAGRCTLGRLFGLRGAARPRARRYAIAHGIRDKVHATNSWQSSRTCAVPMLQVLRMGLNCDAVRQISRYFGRETQPLIHRSRLVHRIQVLSPDFPRYLPHGIRIRPDAQGHNDAHGHVRLDCQEFVT